MIGYTRYSSNVMNVKNMRDADGGSSLFPVTSRDKDRILSQKNKTLGKLARWNIDAFKDIEDMKEY